MRLQVRTRSIAWAVGGALALALSASAAPPASSTVVDAGWIAAGTVTRTSDGSPVSGVCVFPGGGEQVLGPACTDGDGAYASARPWAFAHPSGARSLVVPPSPELVGTYIYEPTTDAALQSSNATVNGVAVSAGTPVPGAVAIISANVPGAIVGAAVAAADGTWTAGVHVPPAGLSVTVTIVTPPGSWGVVSWTSEPVLVQPGQDVSLSIADRGVRTILEARVTLDGVTPMAWQAIYVEPIGPVGAITRAFAGPTGRFRLWLDPGVERVTLGYGGSMIVGRSFPAGVTVLPSARLVPPGGVVPGVRQPPVTWMAPRARVTLSQTPDFAWSGGSREYGPQWWLRQNRTVTFTGVPSVNPVDITQLQTYTWRSRLARGSSACVTIETKLGGGFPQGVLGQQCQSLPLDDRSMSASSGWARVSLSSAYAGTLTTTSHAGSTLTRTGVTGRGLALVCTRRPDGGTVAVTVNGIRVGTVNTRGASTYKMVTYLPGRAMTHATVRVVALTGSPVQIDGLAVLP